MRLAVSFALNAERITTKFAKDKESIATDFSSNQECVYIAFVGGQETIKTNFSDTQKFLKTEFGNFQIINDGINASDATAKPDDLLEGKTAYAGNGKITGTIPTYDGDFSGGAIINTEEYSYYEGTHSVKPSTNKNITLETKKKKLDDNIVIMKIPYAEVSNNSGGYTVSIGD